MCSNVANNTAIQCTLVNSPLIDVQECIYQYLVMMWGGNIFPENFIYFRKISENFRW